MLYVKPQKNTRVTKFAKSGGTIFNVISAKKDTLLSQVETLMFVSAPVLAKPLPTLALKPAAKN